MGFSGGKRQASISLEDNSREEMRRFFPELPRHILTELYAGKMRLGDKIIYSIKPVGNNKTIKFFESQDQKKIGMRSLTAARLPKNQALSLSGIFLLAGVAPAANPGQPTEEEIMATSFAPLTADVNFAALLGGEFTLKSNNTQVIVPETSARQFSNDLPVRYPVGYFKLHNPRLIRDEHEISAMLELGTIQNIPTDTYLWLGLHGTVTTP